MDLIHKHAAMGLATSHGNSSLNRQCTFLVNTLPDSVWDSLALMFLMGILIFVQPILAAIGAQRESPIPTEHNPGITPGELLIRVTSEAQMGADLLHAKAPIHKLHNQMGVQSFHRVFTYIAYPEFNPNLERIYLLRFPVSANLLTLKAAYVASPLIEAVAFNYLRPTQESTALPSDPRIDDQWNLLLINMPEAWAIEKGDPSIIIAVVDSGIDYQHEDLVSQIWVNLDEIPENGLDDDNNGYIDDVRGWDFTDAPSVAAEGDFMEGDNDPIDETGHGTHVAGIAGASGDNGIGIAGVAWNCKLMAVRTGHSIGGVSSLQDDDSSAAIVYAVDNGARIINMSWGSTSSSFVIRDVVDYAYARGVLLVAAAGNDFQNQAIFPAGYRKVLAVAATDQNKRRFYQSNFGASIDIGAPGNVILSTQINNEYRLLTGTSMATPHVCGVAALVMSKRPSLTHEEARNILIATTDSIADSPELVGAGHLNAERALMASGSLQGRIFSPETNSGGSDRIEIIGTAAGFRFSTWQLMYGESRTPETFIPINKPSRQQKSVERLLEWNTASVPEGIYTVRLEVNGSDEKTVRDEVVLSVNRTAPQVQNVKVRELVSMDSLVTVITWSTDDFTINTLSQRARQGLSPFSPIEENSASREHYLSLPLSAGNYDFFITSRNAAGLETVDNNDGKFYRTRVIGGNISPNGFIQTSTKLSVMHLASLSADFDRDGQIEIVGIPLESLSNLTPTGVEIYERSSASTYQLQHTISTNFKPWEVGDTDGDGLLEILGSTKERTFLIESAKRDGYPEKIIWEFPFISSGQIADLDGDGRKEIIGPDNNNNRILIFENRGNNAYEEVISIENKTSGTNAFGERFAIGDFNNNGRMELMVGDSEGELFVYESVGNDLLVETWRDKIDVEDAHLLAAGDLTGDKIPEFVVGGAVSQVDLPSVPSNWAFRVFTAFPPANFSSTSSQNGTSLYRSIVSQEITPFHAYGNSISIGDVDGDSENEMVLVVNPSIYVFKLRSQSTTETGKGAGHLPANESRAVLKLTPVWHHNTGETPCLFLADLNHNGFSEFYVNSQEDLLVFEHVRAGDPNAVVEFQPWGLSVNPLTERVVQVDWQAPGDAARFTVYRAVGTSTAQDATSPPASAFTVVGQDLDRPGFLDRKVTKDTTYWYAVTATNEAGVETSWTEAVSVTPRTSPKLIGAEYIQSNQVVVVFDKRMGPSAGNENRYQLREPDQLVGVRPLSAIRDRMGRRTILTFRDEDLIPGRKYEISVDGEVQDIDRNRIDLRAITRAIEIPLEADSTNLNDFTRAIVYPNPIHPNEFHKNTVTFDRVPTGTEIEIYNVNGDLLEKLTVKERDRGRKEWLLLSDGNSEVTTGLYIYAMEFENLKKIGKIAVIK